MNRRQLMAASARGLAATAIIQRGAAFAGPLTAPVGLELYSLRATLKDDLQRTLRRVRALGFKDVEVPGFYGHAVPAFSAALKAAGLRTRSLVAGFERLEGDMRQVIADARTLGVTWVVCPWIPHKNSFTLRDCDAAAKSFATFGKQLQAADLRFAYHIHGYEFVKDNQGTLLTRLANNTPPEHVAFELDTFWVARGGGDPVGLLTELGSRVPLIHLKDIAKGTFVCAPDGTAPDETSVPLGQGMIDFRGVFDAANKAAAVQWYFIEDEHPNAGLALPTSLRFLKTVGS